MATDSDGLRRDVELLREELDRLRYWRHDTARATFEAHTKEIESLRGRTAVLERRLTDTELSVAQMAEADKIAAAVTVALTNQRGGILTTWQRWGALAVAAAAVVSVGLQIAHALGH